MFLQTTAQPPAAPAAKTASAVTASTADAVAGTLDQVVLGNTVGAWITFGAVLICSFAVAWLIRAVLVARLKKWADRTTTRYDDLIVTVIADVRLLLIGPALMVFAARGLVLPIHIDRILYITAMIGLAIQLILSSRLFIDFGLKTLADRHRGSDGQPDATLVSSLGVLRVIAMVIVTIVVVLLALQNLKVDVGPLVAGLGIGGIAVALAVQNLLGDLFGSLTILLDKPFVVGDSITVGDKSGTVERIGIKTTRVRAVSGEQLVFSNSDLLSSRLHNFKRMQERRVAFSVGVTYETDPGVLSRVPEIVKRVVTSQPSARFDRCHLKTLNSYSVDFETVYFVTVPDFNTYMDIQQAVNLGLLTEFEKAGIEFAYPTQVAVQRGSGTPPLSTAPTPTTAA